MHSLIQAAPIIIPTVVFIAVCVIAGNAVKREREEERSTHRHQHGHRKHA